MTKLCSPVQPHEMPKTMRRQMDDIVRRVAASSAIHGNGNDLLLRIYMAGVYHGLELAPKEVRA